MSHDNKLKVERKPGSEAAIIVLSKPHIVSEGDESQTSRTYDLSRDMEARIHLIQTKYFRACNKYEPEDGTITVVMSTPAFRLIST